MKLRLATPDRLLDIGRLKELKGVRQLSDGRLAIGALTTYAELAEPPARQLGPPRDALPSIGARAAGHRRGPGPKTGLRRRRARPQRSGLRPARRPARPGGRGHRAIQARR